MGAHTSPPVAWAHTPVRPYIIAARCLGAHAGAPLHYRAPPIPYQSRQAQHEPLHRVGKTLLTHDVVT